MITVPSNDHRLLVVSRYQDGPPSTFRVVPQELRAVANNLSLANMDYSDFAESVVTHFLSTAVRQVEIGGQEPVLSCI